MEPTPNVIEPFVRTLLDWYAFQPMVGILLALMFFDCVIGLCAGFITGTLSSVISYKGMIRKVIMLLLVAFSAVLEQLGTGGIPVAKLTSGFFAITEGLSIIENAARAGVPVPKVIVDSLERLRNNEKASVTSKSGSSAVQIGHASKVEMHIDEHMRPNAPNAPNAPNEPNHPNAPNEPNQPNHPHKVVAKAKPKKKPHPPKKAAP